MTLKERILYSARETFFYEGYNATSTKKIAQKAGTSESGIFRIFSNKYEILMSVYNACWKIINDKIDSSIESFTTPKEKILYIAESMFDLYFEDRICMSFIIMNTGNTDTLILERKQESIISEENVKYIKRLKKQCDNLFAESSATGLLTAEALCEAVMSVIEGVLLGWYLVDNAKDYPYKISKKEALNIIIVLIKDKEV